MLSGKFIDISLFFLLPLLLVLPFQTLFYNIYFFSECFFHAPNISGPEWFPPVNAASIAAIVQEDAVVSNINVNVCGVLYEAKRFSAQHNGNCCVLQTVVKFNRLEVRGW
jgi:hypothetical protein